VMSVLTFCTPAARLRAVCWPGPESCIPQSEICA
jgi:hypothetical protein